MPDNRGGTLVVAGGAFPFFVATLAVLWDLQQVWWWLSGGTMWLLALAAGFIGAACGAAFNFFRRTPR